MPNTRFQTVLPSLGLVGVFLVVLLFWVGSSYLEAQAYKRVTGKEVSTFDAMFLNLRVDGMAK